MQLPCIMQYLAEKHNLKITRALQITMTWNDLIQEAILAYHPSDPNGSYESQKKEAEPFIEKFLTTRLPVFLKFFVESLKMRPAPSTTWSAPAWALLTSPCWTWCEDTRGQLHYTISTTRISRCWGGWRTGWGRSPGWRSSSSVIGPWIFGQTASFDFYFHIQKHME